MRLDHIAYRVLDRHKTAEFFCKCMGYKIVEQFQPTFSDGTNQGVNCLVLEPSERPEHGEGWGCYNALTNTQSHNFGHGYPGPTVEWHMAPELFISDGPDTSIVGRWVKEHGPGIHHLAYQVADVAATMKEWQDAGYAEFSSDVIKCEGLEQVFTKPSELTGVVIELIRRDKEGFCKESVAKLMESTNELGRKQLPETRVPR